jgi:regulator of RNase E activity RraA
MAEHSLEPVPQEIVAKLSEVSSATVAYYLLNQGIRRTFMTGVYRLNPGRSMVGYASTLRLLPMREDLYDPATIANATHPQRRLVDNIESGAVMVIDARGELGAGVLGDILVARLEAGGASGVVTDGALRDTPTLRQQNLPLYTGGAHGGASMSMHIALDMDIPVQCGGVTVVPGDVLLGDDEGVVVIPRKMLEQVADATLRQERIERYVLHRVRAGSSIRGVYPPGPETVQEAEEWLAREEGGEQR